MALLEKKFELQNVELGAEQVCGHDEEMSHLKNSFSYFHCATGAHNVAGQLFAEA